MEFNSIVFPRPMLDFRMLEYYKEELFFIPKSKEEKDHIPCLFLRDHNSKSKNIIIMFHGNAEDIFGARNMADAICQKVHMNIILVEYPGYSIYLKEPNSEELLNDTKIIYDFIKEKFNLSDKNIFIIGRSIGTSPAIYLASQRKPNALITISAFTSIKSVADNLVGFLKILVKERLVSIDYIKKVSCPVLLIHGQKDPLIPFKETVALKDSCDCPFEVVLPTMMTHNDFDLDVDIIEPINRFIAKNCNIDKGKNNFDDKEISILNEIPPTIKDYIQNKTEEK